MSGALLSDNRRRAAMALVALGPRRAAQLLRTLPTDTQRELLAEVARVGPVDHEQVVSVLTELAQQVVARRRMAIGDPEYARRVLAELLGDDGADRVSELSPEIEGRFSYLESADPTAAARLLDHEPPGAVAVALAHLRPPVAARILSRLDPGQRAEVARRLARLRTVPAETVDHIDRDFRERLGARLAEPVVDVAGLETLVGMLNEGSRRTEQEVIDALAERDPQLAEQVREALFVFDDIARLDDRAIQQVLKSVETADLATAMKRCAEPTRSAILRNLSERARENLLEEIEFLRSVKAADITEAQKRIVKTVKALEEAGTIVIDRGGDEE